jgi:hypothetical protein
MKRCAPRTEHDGGESKDRERGSALNVGMMKSGRTQPIITNVRVVRSLAPYPTPPPRLRNAPPSPSPRPRPGNRLPTRLPAFTPSLAVLPGGAIGVTYYDFRQAGTATYQPTDYWLTTSVNGVDWTETRLTGNFDLFDAPDAGGLFVGDYQGLDAADASTFLALYSRTNNGDAANRTDVYADRGPVTSTAAASTPHRAASAKTAPWPAEAQARVSQHLASVQEARRARWHAWLEASPPH